MVINNLMSCMAPQALPQTMRRLKASTRSSWYSVGGIQIRAMGARGSLLQDV